MPFVLPHFIVLAALFGPLVYRVDPHATSTINSTLPPSHDHYFGTDNNGRDAFARVIEGARISLLVGISGALVSLFVGTTYGLIAGYIGGRTDGFMMRTVEILYSLPRLIILILFTFIFDQHFKTWPSARTTRSRWSAIRRSSSSS